MNAGQFNIVMTRKPCILLLNVMKLLFPDVFLIPPNYMKNVHFASVPLRQTVLAVLAGHLVQSSPVCRAVPLRTVTRSDL